MHHRVVFLSLLLPLCFLLGNIVLWRLPSEGRRSRYGTSAFLPSKDAKATAYEKEYRHAGDDADEESLVMGYPSTC